MGCKSGSSVCLRATTSLTLYVASSSAWLACSSEATDELKEKRKGVATLPVTFAAEVPAEVSKSLLFHWSQLPLRDHP